MCVIYKSIQTSVHCTHVHLLQIHTLQFFSQEHSASGSGGTTNYSRNAIELSVAQSLHRLQTEYIDMFQIHDAEHCDTKTFQYDVLPTIQDLLRVGKIRAFGITGYPLQMFPHTLQLARECGVHVDTITTYGQCTIFNRNAIQEEFLSEIRPYDVAIINASPLG
uniref:Protein IolS n=1 Tax=Lygus hesperus TaxID=30085 RepID=A0A0A9XT18_LYGHE